MLKLCVSFMATRNCLDTSRLSCYLSQSHASLFDKLFMCDLAKMSRYKPDVIKGDLDSIRSEVKDFYAMLVSTKDSVHKYSIL